MQNGPVKKEERPKNDADIIHRILADEKNAFELMMGGGFKSEVQRLLMN